jgi:hypothetical protein
MAPPHAHDDGGVAVTAQQRERSGQSRVLGGLGLFMRRKAQPQGPEGRVIGIETVKPEVQNWFAVITYPVYVQHLHGCYLVEDLQGPNTVGGTRPWAAESALTHSTQKLNPTVFVVSVLEHLLLLLINIITK